MDTDVDLWTWLLFASGLSTLRAKELLRTWQGAGVHPAEAITALPAAGPHLGISESEAFQLAAAFQRRVPAQNAAVAAITWDAPTYPAGLTTLPLKLQPALLFHRGDPELLNRMIVYLPPGDLPVEDQEPVREVISLLLGEHVLLGVYQDSAQAALVLEELASAEGEVLLFARSGLARNYPTPIADDHPLSMRVLIISPLPPAVPQKPAWDMVLQQVALAAADRVILTGHTDETTVDALEERPRPTVALSSATGGAFAPPSRARDVRAVQSPADVLDWIAGATLSPDGATAEPHSPYVERPSDAKDSFALGEPDTAPPPSPEQILKTLSKGGEIPEVLRRRLLSEA